MILKRNNKNFKIEVLFLMSTILKNILRQAQGDFEISIYYRIGVNSIECLSKNEK